MRKVVYMMMSLFLLFTQCKKENIDEDEKSFVPIRLEMTLDKSRSDFSDLFPLGKISWGNDNNVEYIYLAVPKAIDFFDITMGYYTQHLGVLFEMKAELLDKMDKLVFYGEIDPDALKSKEYCTMYYFGNNGKAEKGTNVTNYYHYISNKHIVAKKMSFDKQNGNIDDLGDYHLAKASVKVKKNVDENGVITSFDLEMESFTTITSLALLDLEGETRLEGSATRLKSFTVKWTSDYVFEEIYEYDTLGYIDVTANVGERSLISFLPTEESVTLECTKGRYEFAKGIKSNQVYLGGKGESINEALPLEWSKP